MNPEIILTELLVCLEQNKPVALATVVSSSGSTPARTGTKMLIYEDGSILGTVGGGALEAKVIEEALGAIKRRETRYLHCSLDSNDAAGLGMVCGGEVDVFIDSFASGPELIIAGAGHISQDLARMAKMLDFHVTVIDDRKDFASAERFPDADRLLVGDIAATLNELEVSGNTYLAILTRGHTYDEAALEKVVSSQAAYIGMIGSRNKISTVFGSLKEKGVPASCLEKVHAPIGLDLGGNSPAEIALSIAAEMVKIRYGG